MFRNHSLMFMVAMCAVLTIRSGAACAAVPVSVAVRAQPPEIETIIAAMEKKARAAVGVWQTRSGREGTPGEVWRTGISEGKEWYWESGAAAPSSTAGYVLFDDGEDAYVLPYGAGGALGGIRFQYDSIRNGFTVGSGETAQNYTLGHYLLHMNLLPRQFIGAMGGLSKVGEEEIDGTKVIHLRADPEADELMKNDPAINRKLGNFVRSQMDLYFDQQRCAMVEVKSTTKAAAGQVRQMQVAVSAWDGFGTAQFWPASLAGRHLTFDPSAKPADRPHEAALGNAVRTEVEKFTPGADVCLVDLEKRLRDCGLVLTPMTVMRNAIHYRQALALSGNLNERAALAWSSFFDNDVERGTYEWQYVERQVSSEDRKRLSQWISEPALIALARASAGSSQRQACAALFSRFVRLPADKDFGEAAEAMEIAWEAMVRAPESRDAIAPRTPDFLARAARTASPLVLERLIRFARANREDAAFIDPTLRAVYDSPVPQTGLFDSRQDIVLVSAVRAEDLPRAEAYLDALRWSADAKPEHRQVAANWRDAIMASRALRRGRDEDLSALINAYGGFLSLKNDRTDQTYGKWFVLKVGSEFLNAKLAEANNSQAVSLLSRTVPANGAAGYWEDQITELAKERAASPESVERLKPLIKALANEFKQPTYACSLWLALAGDQRIRGKDLKLELQYVNWALESASGELARTKAILALGQIYGRAHQCSKGAQAVEAASGSVHDEACKKKLAALLETLRAGADLAADEPNSPAPAARTSESAK